MVYRTRIQENPTNYRFNNDIPHPIDDLDVPPSIDQETSSNTKI